MPRAFGAAACFGMLLAAGLGSLVLPADAAADKPRRKIDAAAPGKDEPPGRPQVDVDARRQTGGRDSAVRPIAESPTTVGGIRLIRYGRQFRVHGLH